jgi:hypothetical protein
MEGTYVVVAVSLEAMVKTLKSFVVFVACFVIVVWFVVFLWFIDF